HAPAHLPRLPATAHVLAAATDAAPLSLIGSPRPADQRDPVANGDHRADHPLVGHDVVVELDDGPGVVVVGTTEDAAVPQDVVDRDQASIGQLGHNGLVVVAVVDLVGVDEHEVEGAGQAGDRLEGRAHADLDAVGVGAGLDVRAGDGLGLGVDVTGDDVPARRQAG